jgi:hypothetical protein
MITNCARPTRAFSSRALREQGDRPSHPASFFSILLNAIVVAISRTDKLFTLLLKWFQHPASFIDSPMSFC